MNSVARGGRMSDLKLMSLLKILHEENKAIMRVLSAQVHCSVNEEPDNWDNIWNKIMNMDDEKK